MYIYIVEVDNEKQKPRTKKKRYTDAVSLQQYT